MGKSLAPHRRILSVTIVAGSSAGALLEKINGRNSKRRLGLLIDKSRSESFHKLDASTIVVVKELARSHDEHSPDLAEIEAQIRAIAGEDTIDHLLIECDPETPAMAYAALFLPGAPLTAIGRLATTVLAINPTTLLDALVYQRADVKPGATTLIAEQLEFVGDIVLVGVPEDPDFKLAQGTILRLNPSAQVAELSDESLETLLSDTGRPFDFAAAMDGAGWRKLIDADESDLPGQDNIISLPYSARRPFHPERFWRLLQKELPGIFRAKGFFWLATRMEFVGGLNLAGSDLHCAPAGIWWADRDEHSRNLEMPERTRKEFKEPFGDRRQAIAFFGIDFDPHLFRAELDACLLTDSEMAGGEESWHTFTDPFPSWSGHSQEHQCDHDHESGDHECCHH